MGWALAAPINDPFIEVFAIIVKPSINAKQVHQVIERFNVFAQKVIQETFKPGTHFKVRVANLIGIQTADELFEIAIADVTHGFISFLFGDLLPP